MEKLIELVREKQFLYHKRNKGYKNTILTDRTWKEIAELLNSDGKFVKINNTYIYKILYFFLLLPIMITHKINIYF